MLAFCSDVSDGAFSIEILYMSIVIEFYENGTLWKVAGGVTFTGKLFDTNYLETGKIKCV